MHSITKFQFSDKGVQDLKEYQYGKSRPVVYLIVGSKEVYIGETLVASNRMKQHLADLRRVRLDDVYIIADETFNKSATLDIESKLIQYMIADQTYRLQNTSWWISGHDYYDREHYQAIFESLRRKLQEMGLVHNELLQLRNSDLFKFSPYKSLTPEQLEVAESIYTTIWNNLTQRTASLIRGKPWTWKTILAIFLYRYLTEKFRDDDIQVGIVVPMTSLRSTIKNVFKSIKGFKANMVLWPNDVTKKKYDILIVDEAHRLQRRKSITNYKSYDAINKKLGLNLEATQLEWIQASSTHQILFYDEWQSVRPSDIGAHHFSSWWTEYVLENQMRVEWGQDYIEFVSQMFSEEGPNLLLSYATRSRHDYDLQMFDDGEQFYTAIQGRNKEVGLARIVAGYARPRQTKNPSDWYTHDITIGTCTLPRNTTASDWVHSPTSHKEAWCIHTIQGYDLNYVWVIIGNDLQFNPLTNQFIIAKESSFDLKWKQWATDQEFRQYILNIYKTLSTRWIKGTYFYVVDPALREYVRERISKF